MSGGASCKASVGPASFLVARSHARSQWWASDVVCSQLRAAKPVSMQGSLGIDLWPLVGRPMGPQTLQKCRVVVVSIQKDELGTGNWAWGGGAGLMPTPPIRSGRQVRRCLAFVRILV